MARISGNIQLFLMLYLKPDFSAPNKVNIFGICNSRTVGFGGWGIFATKRLIAKSQSFVRYSSKYIEI